MRSVVYRTIQPVGLFLGWTVTFFLTAFVVGVLLWPVMVILTLAFFSHASYEAYRAYKDGGFPALPQKHHSPPGVVLRRCAGFNCRDHDPTERPGWTRCTSSSRVQKTSDEKIPP